MRQLKISVSITNRESPSLSKYLLEINKVDLISPDEETRLSALIKKGDKNALERLVKANLRFVVSVAKQYQGHGLSLPDLINEGNIGLVKAAHRFDDTRGFKFISFAVWWIRQSMLQAIGEQSRMIRLPQNKMVLKSKISKANASLEQQLGRQASAEEVADALNMNTDDIADVMGLNDHHVSLDAPFSSEDDGGSLLDTMENENAAVTDEKIVNRDSLKKELRRSLKSLDARQREMICYFFGIGVDYPLSLEDIGKKYDLTTERVRQIKDKALLKLRSNHNSDMLRAYLGA